MTASTQDSPFLWRGELYDIILYWLALARRLVRVTRLAIGSLIVVF